MADETVTLVLDAEQYHREIAKITAANQRLGGSGERIGDGYIRGERAARRASIGIVQGLSTATSATDALLVSAGSLERAFRLPIGLTVFAAAGIALAEVITKVIEKEQKLREEIGRLKTVSLVGADFLGTDQINKNLTDTSAKIKEITDDLIGLRAGKGKFLGIDFMGSETRKFFELEDEKKLADLRQAAVGQVEQLTSKQETLNRIESQRLSATEDQKRAAEDQAALAELEIDHNERLGKLNDIAVAAGLAQTDSAKQLLAAETDRYNIARETLRVKQLEKNLTDAEGKRLKSLQIQQKNAQEATQFFRDIGSGKFAQDDARRQQERKDEEKGRRLISQLGQAEKEGANFISMITRGLRETDRLAARQRPDMSIEELAATDFTNLLELSQYDFSGLQPLDGLTIFIK